MPILEAAIEQAQHAIGANVGGGARGPGVAVLGRLDWRFWCRWSRGAGLIDDDEFLPELGFELRGHDAGHLVGRAARCPRHDNGDRPIRLPGVVLRQGRGSQAKPRHNPSATTPGVSCFSSPASQRKDAADGDCGSRPAVVKPSSPARQLAGRMQRRWPAGRGRAWGPAPAAATSLTGCGGGGRGAWRVQGLCA